MRTRLLPLLLLLPMLSAAPAMADDPTGPEAIAAMYTVYRTDFPEVPSITADALKTSLDSTSPPVLVDVRPAVERDVAAIAGAITADELLAHPDRYRARPIVTYCTIGARSGAFAKTLLEDGWSVQNLDGSLLSWTFAGGPLVDAAGQPTTRVHVYGDQWAIVADGYEAVVTDANGQVVPL